MSAAPTLARRTPEAGPSRGLPRWPDAAGGGPGALRCSACGKELQPGAALAVEPLDGRQPYQVHRPSIAPYCLRAAGLRCQTVVRLLDADAALEFDRAENDHAKGGAE